jgi:hypothetical protein
MPDFKTSAEIEQWYAERIEATRQYFTDHPECTCYSENCISCNRKALVRDEIEDLASTVGLEVK